MAKAYINGREFNARDYIPYYYDHGNMTATLYVYSDSVDDIVELIGEKAIIEVPNEFVARDMKLSRILRYYDNGISTCDIEFIPYDIVRNVQTNTDGIEIVSQAITELAEIIG